MHQLSGQVANIVSLQVTSGLVSRDFFETVQNILSIDLWQRKVVSKMNVGVTLQLFHSPSRVMRIVYILLPLRVGYHKCSINRILPKRPRRWGNRNEIEKYWVNPNIYVCNINFSVTRAEQLLIIFYQSKKGQIMTLNHRKDMF